MTSIPIHGAQPFSGHNSALNRFSTQIGGLLPDVAKQFGNSIFSRQDKHNSDIPPPVSAHGNIRITNRSSRHSRTLIILVILWAITIWWCERVLFDRSIEACGWQHWEQWPSGSAPHHVVLIADPQLVDPHTYPGRPWPLSSLTIFYTDLYLRRNYMRLQKRLHPDTVFFLGDLFDGGREWATRTSMSPEKRYRKYGDGFWMHEYERFRNIFIDHFNDGGSRPDDPSIPTRRLIAGLPGNHDLGFASGIQQPVKERFQAYFGDGSRIDIIGNHSFISIDGVSLSAMDQADPVTGSSGSADGSASSPAMRTIWEPVQEFLNNAQGLKKRLVTEDVLRMKGYPGIAYHQEFSHSLLSPDIVSPAGAFDMVHNAPPIHIPATPAFPNILLTHVPLYRPPNTDCGPLRERGSAIPIQAGYQYQNALTPTISQDIMVKIGASETVHVYSGDDHDYCDVTHTAYSGMVKETTVKSISWAMGVRKPGFLSLSLWNPVDLEGKGSSKPEDTIQQNLCLLPDQLSIFIGYAQLLGLSVIVIAIYTMNNPSSNDLDNEGSILPISNPASKRKDPLLDFNETATSASYSSANSAIEQSAISSRVSGPTKSRGSPPTRTGGYGNIPATSRSPSPAKRLDSFAPGRGGPASSFPHMTASQDEGGYDDWGMPLKQSRKSKIFRFMYDFRNNIWSAAWPVLLWYLWVIWHG